MDESLELGKRKGYKKIELSGILETELGYFFQDSRGNYFANKAGQGELPKISIISNTHPGAYELALISVWKHGKEIRTHYDQKNDKGNYLFPPSREATVSVDIVNPFNEPRVHKFISGGFDQLESYRQEVVEGHRDVCIDPMEGKWTYTYHERFFNWNPSKNLKDENRGLLLPQGVNQIEMIIKDFKRDLTSKGAQATTWIPTADPGLESNRPCLQRIWFRAYEEEDGIGLNANWYFRSRDTKAWFMNGWALIDLVRYVGERLSDAINSPVRVRRVNDLSDSLHFYGHNQKEFGERFEAFKSDDGFEKRVLNSNDGTFKEIIEEERKRLDKNPHYKSSEYSQKALAKKICGDPNATERNKKFVRDFFPEIIGKDSWWENHEHFMKE